MNKYLNIWRTYFLIFLIYQAKSWSLNKILMTGPKFGILTDNATALISFSSNHKGYGLFMDAIGRGAQKAIRECQYQFQWDRWNCDITSAPLLQRGKTRATKETAFVQAITSAGVMYALTRQCSSGFYNVCSCDESKQSERGGYDWNWGGCSDNVKVGGRVTKTLLDNLVTKRDDAAVMHLHNNMAGRKAVTKTMRVMCKCHGPTASCTLKTCWKELASFRKVGRHLKQKYRHALQLDLQEKMKDENDPRRRRLFPVLPGSSVVFIEESPNYCQANEAEGILGTMNRQCSRRHKTKRVPGSERKSCRNLCRMCGYRVKKRAVEMNSTCNCKFQWCCNVKCEPCVVHEDRYYCVI